MRVALRVDASNEMGRGHLARCLALGDAMRQAGAAVTVVSRHLPVDLEAEVAGRFTLVRLPRRPAAAGGDLPHSAWLGTSQDADAADTVAALDQAPDWIVVDHYALDARWERGVRGRARVCVIDDLADRDHDADLLLDQNLHRRGEERYRPRVPRDCRLLIGPRYALLRDEFRRERGAAAPRTGPSGRMLVSFGGVDAGNHTVRALEAIDGLPPFPGGVDVVIGAAHPARTAIAERCDRRGYRCHVQAAGMAALMARADVAVGAGGITLWERCCLGLPTLVTSVSLNQALQVAEAAAAGLVAAPDRAEWDAPSALAAHLRAFVGNAAWRESLSHAGLQAVDGGGARRVLRALGVVDVAVRPARAADAEPLFAWRNDPQVRAASRTTAPLVRDDHQRWLAAALQDPARLLLIGERDGSPVGVVRFDLRGADAEVSIYLSPGSHPPGTGGALLSSAEGYLADHRPGVTRCRAEVLGDNLPSHGLFREGGYTRAATWYEKPLPAAGGDRR